MANQINRPNQQRDNNVSTGTKTNQNQPYSPNNVNDKNKGGKSGQAGKGDNRR